MFVGWSHCKIFSKDLCALFTIYFIKDPFSFKLFFPILSTTYMGVSKYMDSAFTQGSSEVCSSQKVFYSYLFTLQTWTTLAVFTLSRWWFIPYSRGHLILRGVLCPQAVLFVPVTDNLIYCSLVILSVRLALVVVFSATWVIFPARLLSSVTAPSTIWILFSRDL